jgi:hypothetical protein
VIEGQSPERDLAGRVDRDEVVPCNGPVVRGALRAYDDEALGRGKAAH